MPVECKQKIRELICKIRELIWPLLEGNEQEQSPADNEIKETDFKLRRKANISHAYDLAMKYYDDEEKRNSAIEGKSVIFIGTVGFVITILSAVFKNIEDPNLFSVILFGLIIIYLCRVAWFAVKALQVGTYHKIGPSDFVICDSDYEKKLTIKFINYTNRNHRINNLKVDSTKMAQEYFKRAIICIIVYILGLVIYRFWCVGKPYTFIIEGLSTCWTLLLLFVKNLLAIM